MLVGLFEPVGAPWSLDGVPRDFSFGTLPPDWERMEPYLAGAMNRIPSLAEIGVRTFFCGPESFTSDVRPLLGPAPELDGYFVAAGLNSLGILSGGGVGKMLAHWIVDGVPPVDATGVAIDRTAAYETSRRFRAERTVEQLGVLFGDARLAVLEAVDRAGRAPLGAARPAGRGGRVTSPPRRAGSSPSGSPAGRGAGDAAWTTGGRPRTRSSGASTPRSARRVGRARHEPDGQAHGAGTGRGRGAEPAVGQRRDRSARAGSSTPSGSTRRAASSPTSR